MLLIPAPRAVCLLLALLLLSLTSCSSPATTPPAAALPLDQATGPALSMPVDLILPGEQTAGGVVLPTLRNGYSGLDRTALAISEEAQFAAGIDRFDQSSDPLRVVDIGETTKLVSGSPGSSILSWAQYRLPLAGEQPGVVALDINLHLRAGGSPSEYYVGLANFAAPGHWDWHGPFSDAQVALSTADAVDAGADYVSPLGNAFVTVAAYAGAEFDIVAVAMDTVDGADTTAPPAVSALGVTPVSGGVVLEWPAVIAGDLGGYRIYYRATAFTSASDPGVQSVPYLEGTTRYLLSRSTSAPVFMAVTAVDISGNESPLSEVAVASPLPGSTPVIEVTTSAASAVRGSSVTLTASGAESYDFDLDGDGVFELTGDTSGTAPVDTDLTGIVRPAVRGSSGGSSVAYGAVSLIVLAGMPPLAQLTATPAEVLLWDAAEPELVALDAAASTDAEGGELEYAFDPEGDGTYSAFSTLAVFDAEYTDSGTCIAAVLVRDPDGLVDHAYAVVTVLRAAGFQEYLPDYRAGTGNYAAVANVDGHPAVAHIWGGGGGRLLYQRALDPRGDTWGQPIELDGPGGEDQCVLAVVGGRPAVAYFDSAPLLGIKIVRAINSTGQTASDWGAPLMAEAGAAPNERMALADVGGNPALAWRNGTLINYEYPLGSGDVPADWVPASIQIVGSGDVASNPSLAEIGGKPAIVYVNNASASLQYLRSTTSTGRLIGDWPVVDIRTSDAHNVIGYCSLLSVNGNPAVTYTTPADGGTLWFKRASTGNGIVAADWFGIGEAVAVGDSSGTYNQLAIVDGRPAVAYKAFPYAAVIRYSRALDANGATWAPPIRVVGGDAITVDEHLGLAGVAGSPVVVTSHGSTLSFNNVHREL